MEPAERSWTLELPFTVPLSLNDRLDRRGHMAAVHAWREAAGWLARQARIPALRWACAQLHYVPPDSRRRDPLNLVATLKACEDGLVDAGVIYDDSARYHTSVMPLVADKGPPRAGGNRLWLVVSELPARCRRCGQATEPGRDVAADLCAACAGR